jgi:sigma-B regulation protein RsbU (phosphoserine phosphatase)
MSASTDGSKFCTLFYGVYDPAAGTLVYLNAGHNPPFLLRAAGGEPERLEATGMLLGLFPDASYRKGEARLAPGDLLVVFSDGVSEAFNEEGEEFGEDRLLDVLRDRREDGGKEHLRRGCRCGEPLRRCRRPERRCHPGGSQGNKVGKFSANMLHIGEGLGG